MEENLKKRSSHIYRQVRAIRSATRLCLQPPQRNMQNNACTEQVGGGREGRRRGKGKKRKKKGQKKKKAYTQNGGRAFFSLFEISDVNRKQQRQFVKSTALLLPLGKISDKFSLSPMVKSDVV